ncbi:MAG: Cell wall-associated hydrolases (invasion-associated proteins) [Phormidesmis priestleyi Ana]|uniref:Cell wall-associated hydrolases (Invasion-associated proteins) n=1 Tax=Phormidesmis priestleyi Ana TaxID=1666911 RepID=A0A0P7ZPX3_9CYAN|nr:MAG: Cell wall-associated hydrolases (invasion-associated proteins) [Phormidesmis priestleyi Ana]
MVTLETLQDDIYHGSHQTYQCDRPINLYSTSLCQGLVTQADAGHQLHVLEIAKRQEAIRVRICKDDYLGWITATAVSELTPTSQIFEAPILTRPQIQARLPQVIAFAHTAMAVPNQYQWGGAVPPHYDCSGLVQSAFAAAGILLPRDSYQQEDFTEHIEQSELQSGDLVFFGTPKRTTHVALYIGDGRYIHSSGKDKGRNGIGIDSLTDLSEPVSASYHALLRCFGRVTQSYQPTQGR